MDHLRRCRCNHRAPVDGYAVNFPFAGWLVQRQLNKKITLGGELFGHGAEGEAALSTRSSTMLDLGGIYEFHGTVSTSLFAAGRSIYGQPETYTYLSLSTGPGDRRMPTKETPATLPAL